MDEWTAIKDRTAGDLLRSGGGDDVSLLRAVLLHFFDAGRHAEVFDAAATAERETL